MPSHVETIATIPQRDVPVLAWGGPGASPLLLLHGLFGNSHEWNSVAEKLSRGRQVIVPDQRGHGEADWGRDYTAGRLVSDVSDLVTVLGLESFDLVGHSMGGIVSMLYAAAHPDRVRRLVLLDIGPETLSDETTRSQFLAMLQQLDDAVYDSPDDAVSQWELNDPLARHHETWAWARRGLRRGPDGAWRWRADIRGIGGFLVRPPAADVLWSAVEHIRAPTLIVHGELSWALRSREAHQLAGRMSDCHVVEIAGAGHDLGVQAPDLVADHISAFLDRTAESPSAR